MEMPSLRFLFFFFLYKIAFIIPANEGYPDMPEKPKPWWSDALVRVSSLPAYTGQASVPHQAFEADEVSFN